MDILRRGICLLLVLTMMLSACGEISVTAFADGPNEATDVVAGSAEAEEPMGAMSPGGLLGSSASGNLADFLTDAENIDAGDIDVPPLDASANVGNKAVSFPASDVSGLAYTVDFEYTNPETGKPYTYHLEGAGSITLKELAVILGITAPEKADEFISNVADVQFSNEDLLKIQQSAHDGWVLTSLVPFSSEEALTIPMKSGAVIGVRVTDVQESTVLSNFLTNAVIVGATQNENGEYVVEQGEEYTIILSFAENSSYQFDNDGGLVYQMPEGITIINEQTGPLTINIVYKGKTYQVDASFELGTDGNLKITFDQNDPDYPRLEESTNVSFRFTYHAQFDGSKKEIEFSDGVERDIVFAEPEPGQAYAQKNATYDETTGTFHYTVTVTATGDVTDVNVMDALLGEALIFNNDVQVSGYSGSYTDNHAAKGFDYTFAEMHEGDVITITYSAAVDFGKDTNKDGKITADQTKNTVTVEPDPGDPHSSEYSREIQFKTTVKSDGTEAGTTDDGDKIIEWSIDYNQLALAAAAGDTIRDTISAGSADYMKYYGDGITVEVRDKNGNFVRTNNIAYEDLTAHSDSSWTYTIPSTDTTPYSYHITYQTVVDMDKVNGGGVPVTLNNDGNGDGGSATVGPTAEIGVTKDVESFTTEEINWVSTLNIPETGLSQAVVTDTLPVAWFYSANYFDFYKDGTLSITGLLDGESYTVDTSEDGKVKITFFKDTQKTQTGLQGCPGGHTITVRLTTTVNQEWLQYGYDPNNQNYFKDHENKIDLNGKEDRATVTFGKPGIEKKGESLGEGSFKYTVILSGVSETPVSVVDTFDTSLLEIDPTKVGTWDDLKIWGGDQYYQGNDPMPISYTETENGLILTANSVPMQADGHFYPYYKMIYYLRLKDGVDLEQLAIANGGEYHVINTAVWGDHGTEYDYKVVYNALNKELLNAGELGGTDRKAQYKITFNPAKATLNGGEPMEMKDVLSANLSLDYSSVQITTDPAGAEVPYSISGGKDEDGNPDGTTVATYIIPDATKVTITYDADVRGNGSQKIVNKVSINGYDDTEEHVDDYGAATEGEGAVASFKIVKVDGYNANKKLSGVKFRVFCEDPDVTFKVLKEGPDKDEEYEEIVLETDENGEIFFDGADYSFYFDKTYHVQEIEEPDGYGKIGFDYLVTLTTDMALVDYGAYIYYFSDTMQIKNWPLEGLVVEKQVESEEDEDLDRNYKFRVYILNDDGSVNTDYNEKNGDDQFVNGKAEFMLKHNEQKMFWGFLKGTKYKVEEYFTDEDGNEFTVNVGYDIFNEEGEVIRHETETGTSHSGTLTQSDEIIVFTNTKGGKGDLKISKTVVSDVPADASQVFTFTITLDPAISGTYSGVTFNENGVGTVTITGSGSKTIEGLPVGTTYEVTEAAVTDFSNTDSDGTTGTITKTLSEASFENTRDTGNLKISKTVVSDVPADANQVFTFTITLDPAISGTYSGVTFNENGVGTVTITGSGSKTIEGLPVGTTYEVTEAAVTDFSNTDSDGTTGTITKTLSEASFENTRDTGNLKISKTVVSDVPADASQVFTFTITLDPAISGTYSGVTFNENGVGTVTITGSGSKTIEGLPVGTTYEVTEAAVTDFSNTDSDGTTGTITKTLSEASFENTRDTGNLKISKTVVSDVPADANQVFTFTITLDPAISGTYSGVTFNENGVGTVTITGSGSKTIEGLPVGTTYEVTEAAVTDFSNTDSDGTTGTITKTLSEASFENTRDTGNLKISKTVVSDVPADASQVFTFTITLDPAISGTYSGVTFNENGVGTVTITGSGSKTIEGLPVGTTYEVTEAAVTDFSNTDSDGTTGTITKTLSEASFENTRDTGNLKISKTVVSDVPADASQVFTFTITLDPAISGTYSGVTFNENGVGTVTITGSGSKTIEGLPVGTTYEVTEAAVTDFSNTDSDGTTGTITKTLSEASFENTRDTGNLKISKTVVSDVPADASQVFTFTITLDPAISGTYSGVTFNENGVGTVTITGSGSKTIEGLPVGTTYEVTEAAVTDFSNTDSDGTTGTITKTLSEASFENTRDTGNLKISKTVVSDVPADASQVFTFTITLDPAISGTYSGVTFNENGVGTVTITGSGSKTIEGLPVGTTYEVTEAAVTDFSNTDSDGTTGTITKTLSEASFENTRDTGNLKISKTVVSDVPADASQVFTFTITLDPAISGTYSGVTFNENGVGTVTITGSGSKTIEGLPVGTTYEVTEAAVTDFSNTDSDGTTGTITKTLSEASFENTRDTGNLKISKTVVSDVPADASQVFTFTITLDPAISGTYSGVTFNENGVGTVTITGSGSKTIEGLPVGTTYEVTEAAVTDFSNTDSDGTTGTITKTLSEASFENTRDTGNLKISKTVVSDVPADASQVFTFTITLDPAISGTYSGVTFNENGVGTVTITGSGSKTIEGLPVGTTYEVTEAAVTDFSNTDSDGTTGTITKTLSEASFENTRDTGNLKISKTVVSDVPADASQVFTFTITLDPAISGTYSGVTFNENGVGTVTITGSGSKTIEGLPVGTTYEVTEAAVTDFSNTDSDGTTGTITKTLSEASFENTRDTGNLKISKTVVSDVPADASQVFTFTITLDPAISGTYSGVTFNENGVGTVTITGSGSKTIEGLPVGTTYEVTEAAVTDFSNTDSDGTTGTITKTLSEASFENTRDTGNLKISKTVVSDVPADASQVFTFTITLDPAISGTYSGVTFNENGVGTVEITGTDSKKIEGLPVGTAYTVTETAVTNFTNTDSDSTSGTITTAGATASFTNTRDTGSLTITKNVTVNGDATSGTLADGTYTFHVYKGEVTADTEDKEEAGDPITVTISDGQASTGSLSDLLPGKYTVYEEPTDGMTLMSDNYQVVEITESNYATPRTAEFTNNKEAKGSLKIKKAVTENGSFTLSDAAKAKLAGDYTFIVYTDENCTIPLQKESANVTVTLTISADGSSVTSEEITDIPAGTYYIKETSPTTSNPSPVTNPVTVTVEVGKTGDATVIATITNDYKHVEAAPEVNKLINVWPENVTSFDFMLTAGTNDADVTIPMPASGGETAGATSTTSPAIFGTITFEAPGTYNYIIKEVVPEDDDPTTEGIQKDGVTYTDTEYPVQIVVEADSTTGQLKTPVIKYGATLENNLTVTNTYAAEGKGEIKVQKILEGREWTDDDEFTFTISAAEGTPMPVETSITIKKTDEDQIKSFGEITFTAAGEYSYTVKEIKGTAGGITYDETEHTVTIKVKDDGRGNLVADGTPLIQTEEVTNTYDAIGKYVPGAKKILYGRKLQANEFRFTLTAVDESGNALTGEAAYCKTVTNAADGTVTFPEINYLLSDLDQVDGHTIDTKKYYRIEEDIPYPGEKDMTYSTVVYKIAVTLHDNGDGVITSNPDKKIESIVFTNNYTPEQYDYKFSFTKKWSGGREDSIDWVLYSADGTVVHKKFNKKTVSENEWYYEAWFQSDRELYLIETVPQGYHVRYENIGEHVGVTDRCYNGGTIINYKVPATGDDSKPILWISCVLSGLALLGGTCLIQKRKKKN